MAEDPQKDAEIQAILSDLDKVLSDPSAAPSAPMSTKPPPAQAGPETVPPSAPESPKPPAAATPPKAPPPLEAKPAPSPEELKIELAPREGTIHSSASSKGPALASQAKPPLEINLPPSAAGPPPAPESPKPPTPAPPKAALPSAPVSAKPSPILPGPGTAAPPASTPISTIPPTAAKDQIRRAVFLYSVDAVKERDAFIAFLDQSAATISKKPLYLRKVLVEEVNASTDIYALAGKIQALKVVAVFGVWSLPEAKAREIGEVITTTGVLFRAVPLGEVQKKSVAVDIIVDMMLLGGES